jgi:hypothetical protein
MRSDFERLIIDDLLGPAQGPDEVIMFPQIPRDRYLVGFLAPRESYVSPSRFDSATAAEAGGTTSEDHVAARPQAVPSAIGLTFVVPIGTLKLLVEATWGHYHKASVEIAEGKSERVWQRIPSGGQVEIALPEMDAAITPKATDPSFPAVVVQGRARLRGSALVVTLFLVNGQVAAAENVDERWLFQAQLTVRAPDNVEVFLDREAALGETVRSSDGDDEAQSLDMLYRHAVDFAVGHGTAVHVTPGDTNPTMAVKLETRSIPIYDVPRTEPPTTDEIALLSEVTLDMRDLARADDPDLPVMLEPLVTAYRNWINEREAEVEIGDSRFARFQDTAKQHLARARDAAERISAGIALLRRDETSCEAFRFANEAMWRQRVRQEAINRRRREPDVSLENAVALADESKNRKWRPFQLAFLLLNLPALTDPRHRERSGDDALVDLLFFPTGGGKTEAYLGLAAYVLGVRRLQGTLSSDEGDLDGSDGLAVLMRYTLRLLTAQQFQRAASLVTACEVIRRERIGLGETKWGVTPFRLGLWIGGSSTPNTTEESARAVATARNRSGSTGSYADPLQIGSCPWCGTPLTIAENVYINKELARTIVACPDPTFGCPFTKKRSSGEGIPVVTVDEEIYRLLPGFLIATVDKFAQLPLRGALHTLFGRVSSRCTRHGFRSRDIEKVGDTTESDSHSAKNGCAPAQTLSCDRLRPPDLVIQDELHLISGPLGTLVGLYETAIDDLATASYGGVRSRPKVVASTATIRRAAYQVRGVFDREVRIFPPPGLGVMDTFFSRERKPTDVTPGRRYIGVCARGQRMKAVEARAAITVLAAAQTLVDRYGDDADPYQTMLCYFSSLRELAGMKRMLDDDVQMRLPMAAHRPGLGRRRTPLSIDELTSRVGSDEIVKILDRLGKSIRTGVRQAAGDRPPDAVLATNMISVGVDVPRLGLMMVAGQPKSTAEYIQATSRVGRSVAVPGFVITLYNWSRPRDVSHYERFEHDHATFYRQVEPLSVTPFAARALDRGLTAVVVGIVRHEHADRALGAQTNPNASAQIVPTHDPAIVRVAATISKRAGRVGTNATEQYVDTLVRQRLSTWAKRQYRAQTVEGRLAYRGSAKATALLNDGLSEAWDEWSVPNSLREVEREINFQLDDFLPINDTEPTYLLNSSSPSAPTSALEDEPGDAAQ